MAEEDVVSVTEHYADDDRTVLEDEHVDIHDGENMLSFPDNTNAVVTLATATEMVRQAIDAERERYFDLNKGVLRVNTNKSGGIQFRTYQITAAMGPVLIVKEKENRGNLIINCLTTGEFVWIGDNPGITPGGSNTVAVVGNVSLYAPRIVRTRKEIWAVTDSDTAVTFDVQEEFD